MEATRLRTLKAIKLIVRGVEAKLKILIEEDIRADFIVKQII